MARQALTPPPYQAQVQDSTGYFTKPWSEWFRLLFSRVNGTIRSQVRLDTDAGAGSSNTRVRNFTNNTTTGTDLTGAVSATAGASITVNADGLYFILWSGIRFTTTGETCQISINSTSFVSSPSSSVLCQTDSPASSAINGAPLSALVFLPAGTVIRFITFDASVTSSGSVNHFVSATKVAA